MSLPAAPALPASGRVSALAGDAGLALAGTLLLLAFHAATGFRTLADGGGDNDSLLRLVQVRDLVAGQGWFDLTLYRMGLEGGFVMHWSRLVDLPIALLAIAFGETTALIAWPALLFGTSLFLIIRAARTLGGEWAVLPATIVGGMALYFVNIFRPGALDHHNLQLTLALAALVFLLDARTSRVAAALAGGAAALMLAVGMEAAPYVATACAVPTVLYLLYGEAEAGLARRFGLAFAGVSLAALAATVPARDWLAVHCDAFSMPQASLAVLGGGGLALIASVPALGRSAGLRLAALAGLGALAAATVLAAFPQCLADPYADVDPILRRYWLSAVTEAQSVVSVLRASPGKFAVHYVTPLIALATLGWAMARRRDGDREAAIVMGFLAAAVLVSFWQVRGAAFSVPLATVPLAAWIAAARSRAAERPTAAAQLAMAATWLASVNILWQVPTLLLDPWEKAGRETSAGTGECYADADYDTLAAMPAGLVLAVSNQGSAILRQTPHRVLNGPYHRNNEGNLAALELLMGEPAEAEARARRLGVAYVALCRGNPETRAISGWAPDGFLPRLAAGDVPSWLTLVPETQGQAVEVYRVGGR